MGRDQLEDLVYMGEAFKTDRREINMKVRIRADCSGNLELAVFFRPVTNLWAP
jgi:hypothetical protein